MKTLAQGKLGGPGLWTFAIVASSPMTVQVGGIPTMYAATGVIGVPLAFVVVAAVLMMLAVGYVAACGHIRHAAPFYALLARGVSPTAGVAGGAVALLGYLTIQTSLYGLVGATMAGLFRAGTWWGWAAAAWLLVTLLGLLGGLTSARVLGALLVLEVVVIALYAVLDLAKAAGPVTWQPLAPSALLVPGMAGVIAFAMAAFVGVETVPAYSEEARGARQVRTATLAAIGFCGGFYALMSWAMAVGAGTDRVVEASGATLSDPDGPATAMFGTVFGLGYGLLATMLVFTSIIAALTSFHATFARYVFAMARERVLPPALARVSARGDGGTPVAASLMQSLLAACVIAVFAATGANPVTVMFAWLSTIGAVSLLMLLVVAAPAAQRFFASGQGTNDSLWVRRIAPAGGCVLGVVLMAMMLTNLASLLGLPPGSRRWLLVPVVVAAALACGLVWGLAIRVTQPDCDKRIGRVVADPATSKVARLASMVM